MSDIKKKLAKIAVEFNLKLELDLHKLLTPDGGSIFFTIKDNLLKISCIYKKGIWIYSCGKYAKREDTIRKTIGSLLERIDYAVEEGNKYKKIYKPQIDKIINLKSGQHRAKRIIFREYIQFNIFTEKKLGRSASPLMAKFYFYPYRDSYKYLLSFKDNYAYTITQTEEILELVKQIKEVLEQ